MSTGLTVCYSFRLFYFVLFGDFNYVPSYSMVETNYSKVKVKFNLEVHEDQEGE